MTAPAVGVGDRIVEAYGRLERLALGPGLEPGDEVDAAFRELVGSCPPGAGEPDGRLAALAPRLRALCAEGEFRLELAWARRIAAGTHLLAAFPYEANYRALTALELHTAAGLGAAPGRVCVLGSGPLPLTALLAARALGRPVDAVDLDPEAVEAAGAALRRLPGGELVRPHLADARDFAGVADADLVVLAALVGLDPAHKRAVIAAVVGRMRPGAMLVVRTACGLRALLYPPVGPVDLAAAGGGALRLLAEVHPLDDVVNSLVFARRR